jgi:ankyrin repeat protein
LTDSAYAGNVESATGILAAGCNVNERDSADTTALDVATSFGQDNMVRFLIERGANCNIADPRKQTPIFAARSRLAAKMLIDAGANLSLLDDNGQNCVQVQIQRGQIDVAKFLNEQLAAMNFPTESIPNDSQPAIDGGAEILKYLESTGNHGGLAILRSALSVDYGSVLPVRSLPFQLESTENSRRWKDK